MTLLSAAHNLFLHFVTRKGEETRKTSSNDGNLVLVDAGV